MKHVNGQQKSSEEEQANMVVSGGTCRGQFWELFQFSNTQIYQFDDKNGFIDSKNLVSILLWNQGNHNMGHLMDSD